jgi:hypothetical protein
VCALVFCLAAAQACLSKEAPRETAPSPAPPPSTPPVPPAEPATTTPAEGEAAPAPAADGEASKPASQLVPRKVAPAPSAARPESAGPPKAEAKRSLDVDDSVSQAGALMQQLRSTPSMPTADCPAAREQRATICALAERICRLVDRDPNVASIADYCTEARQRCADAGRRTAERCD